MVFAEQRSIDIDAIIGVPNSRANSSLGICNLLLKGFASQEMIEFDVSRPTEFDWTTIVVARGPPFEASCDLGCLRERRHCGLKFAKIVRHVGIIDRRQIVHYDS